MASALPHDQMVNNEFNRDVGVLHPNMNFTNTPLYLVMQKQAPKCEMVGLPHAASLASIQICVRATCVLYNSGNCTSSKQRTDYYFEGPIDVDNLWTLPDITCGSYMCGPVEEMAAIIGDSAGASVKPESGRWGVIGAR